MTRNPDSEPQIPPLNKLILAVSSKYTLLMILLLALVVRLWGISFGLPDIEHGDESEVVNHAVRFGSGDLDPHRFQYGSLFQYTLFIFYAFYYLFGYVTGAFASVQQFAVHFVQDPTVFYLIARGLSAILGTLTVALTYGIAKNIKNHQTGLIAALFLTVSYSHAIHSHYSTVDSAVAFLFTAAIYTCLRLFEDASLTRYFTAGFLIGLAVATKFNGIIALVALVSAHFLRKDTDTVMHKFFSKKLALGIIAIFIGHFAACPFFYIDLGTALAEIAELKSFHAAPHLTLFTYARDFMKEYWGLPLGALCMAGFFWSAFTVTRKRLVLLITITTVLCFVSQYKYVEAKYMLYSFPLFAVLGALLFVECFNRVKQPWFIMLILIIMCHPLYLISVWDYEHAQKSINLEAQEWIEANIKINSTILLDNVGNAGPKLENAPEQLQEQYQRALKHKLLKADYLKLKLETKPKIYYKVFQVDSAAGSRLDDYASYRLWQDTEEIGHPVEYYRNKGVDYLIITDRYFSQIRPGFKLIKEFKQGNRAIRIYGIK